MATAASPTQKIEELLECCVCLNTLTEPRTLPCFHSLCEVCLARYVETQRTDARREGRAQHLFNCPSCRTQFQLRQNDSVEGLPSNFLINNLLDILKIQQETEKLRCESCKSQIPAECRCIDCERYLCKNCLTTHSNWPDFKDHAVLTLQELAKPENIGKTKGKPRCKKPDHENKVKKFYCNTCQTLACMNCVLLDHAKAGHDYQAINVVATQHKEALRATSAILQRKSNDGENALKKIQAASQNLQTTAKKAKDAILQQKTRILDEFTKKLDRNTAVLLGDVDKKCNDIKQKLSKQQKEMKEYVAKVNGSLNMANNIIEKGSNEEILSFQSEIEVNAKKIDKECPKMMRPMHNGDIYYQGKSVESVVENLDVTDLGNVIVSPVLTQEEYLKAEPAIKCLCQSSKILNGDLYLATQLAEWLQDKMVVGKLCYRATDDGWKREDFYRKCYDVGPTVTLVKCGISVFGGFTDQSWKHAPSPWRALSPLPGVAKRSETSFLFSLRNKDNIPPFKCPIYDHRKNTGIICRLYYGAIFGGDLFISSDANTNQHSCSNLGVTYQPPPGYQLGTPETKALLAGSQNFTPTEIEVFSI